MLNIEQLQARYGATQALFDISLCIRAGHFVTLLGRNGMGKTTTVRAIMGQVARSARTLQFDGMAIEDKSPDAIARAGVGLVPEGRRVFPTLTVRENLIATGANRTGLNPGWNLERVYKLFPRMQERAQQYAGTLSGGEQQMLAISRALMTNPKLLILDEATEGLAPLIRKEIWSALEYLRSEGQSILAIDKGLMRMLPLADHHYLIEKGRTVWHGTSNDLLARPELAETNLGI